MQSQVTGVVAGCLLAATLCAGLGAPSEASAGSAPVLLAQAAPTSPPPGSPPSVAPPPEASGPAVGHIRFSGGEIAVGIGYSWGGGTIAFAGAEQHFHISGVSIANVGATSMTATGEVYNLRRLEDFAGDYAAVAAGATVGSGASVAYLRNAHGVVIKITTDTKGLDFQLSGNGVKISLG